MAPKSTPQAAAPAARHADAAQHHAGNGVHLVAVAGGGRVGAAVHGDPEKRPQPHQQTADDKDDGFHYTHMDACQPGAFLVAADGVDLFAELGAGGKINEHRRKGQQHQPHQGQGGKLAVAEAVEGLVSGQPGIHLVHRGPAPDEIFRQVLAEVLGQGAIDEHGGQGHDEGGHFHNAHQHPVHSPQQRPGCQRKDEGEQDAAGGVEHHHRKPRIHGQDGPGPHRFAQGGYRALLHRQRPEHRLHPFAAAGPLQARQPDDLPLLGGQAHIGKAGAGKVPYFQHRFPVGPGNVLRPLSRRVAHHLLGDGFGRGIGNGTFCHKPAVAQHRVPVRKGKNFRHFVGDEQEGGAVLLF